MQPTIILAHYTRTYELICRLITDVTHDESLMQWQFSANCMNWLLGHVAVSRWNILGLLGDTTPIWDFAQAKRYIPNSAPIAADADDITSFDTLCDVFDRTQQRFSISLAEQTAASLATTKGDKVVGETLLYYAQHEAYHSGQIELCRMMVGKSVTLGFE